MKAQIQLSTTRKKRQKLNQTALDIQANAITDAVIQALVDEWIVPAIVDQLIRTMSEKDGPTA